MPTRRAISFNHLVSAGEQRRRYLKAERPHQAADFRSIDYQKEFVDDLSSLPSKRAQILSGMVWKRM